MNKIHNISYINDSEINRLYDIIDVKDHVKVSPKTSIELGTLTGLKTSIQFESKEIPSKILDKLISVWEYLDSSSSISYKRVNRLNEAFDGNEFTFEKTIAHKFFFPKSALAEIEGLQSLVVWVSEPIPGTISNDPSKFDGTFLYLLETMYDNNKFAPVLSGCSALQAISNIVSGKPFYTIDNDEILGRWNNQHPFEKIRSLGAIYIHKQTIHTLYRNRYLTDEQVFNQNGKDIRCNDLLSYPLFIS